MNSCVIPFQLHRLDKLHLNPPPAELFEELFGYAGSRRWVGFYYQNGCLYHSAGEGTCAGNWQPWLIWHWSLRHEIVGRYCFGYDDTPARHMLVVDRKSRALYAGELEVAAQVLRRQMGPCEAAESGEVTRDHLERLKADLLLRLLRVGPDEYLAHRKKLDEGLDKLQNWLSQREIDAESFCPY